MADHYFTAQPSAGHRPREITETLRGREFVFLTDAGVFSRDRIDTGTRLLIEHLPLPVSGTALDIGCGYGPIGLTMAAHSPDAQIIMVDVNGRAADLARRNLQRNGIGNATVVVGDGFEAVPDAQFSLIVSNPPIRAGKRVVYPWVDEAYKRLAPGGRLLMVARTSQGAKSLGRKIAEVFGGVSEPGKGSGYRVLEGVRA